MSDFNHCHRTSAGRFLNESPWKDGLLKYELESYIIRSIYNHSTLTGKPIFVLIDDTLCEKTKPSSRAVNIIEKAGFHKSHTKGKKIVYGHQFVGIVLRCGNLIYPYKIVPYEKEKQTKIEIAENAIKELPTSLGKIYIQADSWYTSDGLITASKKQGFQYLGAVKTNRKIYPKAFKKDGIQLQQFAKTLNQADLDLVTVGKIKYWTYTYEGKINGGHLVKIVLSWPFKAPLNETALRCFLSTDRQMSGKRLLNLYTNRWEIEVFFRYAKQNFGMDKYQIHTFKGIKRYMLLIQFAYTYLSHENSIKKVGFGEVLRKEQKSLKQKLVLFVMDWTLYGADEDQIFEALNIA
jgi:hypothetical protein